MTGRRREAGRAVRWAGASSGALAPHFSVTVFVHEWVLSAGTEYPGRRGLRVHRTEVQAHLR